MRSASNSWLSALLLPLAHLQRLIHSSDAPRPPYRFPAEWEYHRRTLMAWPDRSSVERDDQLQRAWTEVADLAQTIARFEPVWVYSSPENAVHATPWVRSVNVTVQTVPVDHPWMRSVGLLFAESTDGRLVGIAPNDTLSGHELSSHRRYDIAVAARILDGNDVYRSAAYRTFTADRLEVDGGNTLLAMESLIYDTHTGPKVAKQAIEIELQEVFGIEHTMWLPGSPGFATVKTHLASLARFAPNNTVHLSRPNIGVPRDSPLWRVYHSSKETLQSATNAAGHRFRMVEIEEALTVPYASIAKDPANRPMTSYLDYYLPNGAVIVPQYGDDRTNDEAKRVLKDLWPEREVVDIKVNMLAWMRGAVHLATMPWPITGSGFGFGRNNEAVEGREDEL